MNTLDDRERLEAQLARIKEIMELASEYKLLPDWAAIWGGASVLSAAAVTWALTRSGDVRAVLALEAPQRLLVAGLWLGAALFSLFLYYHLALRKAKELGVSLESRPSRLARKAMGPAILAAAIISLRLLLDGTLGFIPGVWILLYGVGLYTAGLFSTPAPRSLGLAFIATGAFAILGAPESDLWWTALSFGGYHVAFGCYVLRKKGA